ncbi:hypothetical protein [Modestobacter marinus]|uniref:hypothetical protein n=1 Tax=Modestobacter marinus TaxID=477641 RepID=UPI001C972770|nr:hypothetical protein [Modestobacter marinus]
MIAYNPSPSRPPGHRAEFTRLRRRRGWELHPGVRSPDRLPRRERAAAWLADRIGSWTFVVVVAVLLEVGMVAAVRQDRVDGAVALLGVVVSGLVLLDLSILLMTIRRADRTAEELAVHHLATTGRTAEELEELRRQVELLSVEVARLHARLRAWQQ